MRKRTLHQKSNTLLRYKRAGLALYLCLMWPSAARSTYFLFHLHCRVQHAPSTLNLASYRQNAILKKPYIIFQSLLFVLLHCLVHFLSIYSIMLRTFATQSSPYNTNTFQFHFHSVYFRYSSKFLQLFFLFSWISEIAKQSDLYLRSRWSVGCFLFYSVVTADENKLDKHVLVLWSNRSITHCDNSSLSFGWEIVLNFVWIWLCFYL